jgi:hypothetical protein
MPSETVELRGHIIDSLILPKVLDEILTRGGSFKIGEIKIGQNRVDQSYARVELTAASDEVLGDILLRLRHHGAEVAERKEVQLAPAPADGVFPDDFYVTTNQQTFVHVSGHEIAVESPMIDSAIRLDRDARTARCLKFDEVRKAMKSWSVNKASVCRWRSGHERHERFPVQCERLRGNTESRHHPRARRRVSARSPRERQHPRRRGTIRRAHGCRRAP